MSDKSNLDDLNERFKAVKDQLKTASIRKDFYEEEISQLTTEYKKLEADCKKQFNCSPKDLSSKINEIEEEVEKKLETIENLIAEINGE